MKGEGLVHSPRLLAVALSPYWMSSYLTLELRWHRCGKIQFWRAWKTHSKNPETCHLCVCVGRLFPRQIYNLCVCVGGLFPWWTVELELGCSRCAPQFCGCPGVSHVWEFVALLLVCAQALVFPSGNCCVDRSIPIVKLRHRLLQKKCSGVMVSQSLSYGEYSDRHDVYPKTDLNGNSLGYGFPLCDRTGSFLLESFLFKGVAFELVNIVGAVAVELVFGSILAMAVFAPQFCVCPGEPHDSKFCLTEHTAKHQTKRNPVNAVFEAKWLIDRKFADPIALADMKLWTVKVLPAGDPGLFMR